MNLPQALYEEARRCLPIACVDLVVTSPDARVLLLRRANAPARGQWWFPGGRVLHGERRVDAAVRKLREECGLEGAPPLERGTHDVLLDLEDGATSHAVTTIFLVRVEHDRVRLDEQSTRFAWRTPDEWRRDGGLHPFIREGLEAAGAGA